LKEILNILTFSSLLFYVYKSMVRSDLDYCSSVCNPYHKGDRSSRKSSETSYKKFSHNWNTYHIVTVWEHVI